MIVREILLEVDNLRYIMKPIYGQVGNFSNRLKGYMIVTKDAQGKTRILDKFTGPNSQVQAQQKVNQLNAADAKYGPNTSNTTTTTQTQQPSRSTPPKQSPPSQPSEPVKKKFKIIDGSNPKQVAYRDVDGNKKVGTWQEVAREYKKHAPDKYQKAVGSAKLEIQDVLKAHKRLIWTMVAFNSAEVVAALVEYKRRKNVVEQMINNMQTPKNIDKTKLIADANKDNQNTLYARLIAAGSTTAVQAAIMMWGKRRLTQSIANQAAARGTQASKVSRFMPNLYGLLATAAVMGATWILDDWLADKYVQSLINEWFLETADELGFDTAGIDITDMPSKQANKGIYLLGQDAGQPS